MLMMGMSRSSVTCNLMLRRHVSAHRRPTRSSRQPAWRGQSRKYFYQLAKDFRAIYTAPSAEAAWAAFEELEEKWGKPYPAIPKCGGPRGRSSPPSSPTTWRYGAFYSPPTRSSP